MHSLPNISIASFLWGIDKQQQNAVSDQGLHCLLKECSIKIGIKVKNITKQPLKWKWAGPIDNSG